MKFFVISYRPESCWGSYIYILFRNLSLFISYLKLAVAGLSLQDALQLDKLLLVSVEAQLSNLLVVEVL